MIIYEIYNSIDNNQVYLMSTNDVNDVIIKVSSEQENVDRAQLIKLLNNTVRGSIIFGDNQHKTTIIKIKQKE